MVEPQPSVLSYSHTQTFRGLAYATPAEASTIGANILQPGMGWLSYRLPGADLIYYLLAQYAHVNDELTVNSAHLV
jgi:hypothetical protein